MAEYRVSCYYEPKENEGIHDFEQELEDRVGMSTGGAGFGFGQRDLSWYGRKKKMFEVFDKLGRSSRVKGLILERVED